MGEEKLTLDLSCLNESQRKAVTDTEGAVLVFAGAGSGKTRVLTYRVAYLINNNIDSRNILAITFTNKATIEMKERLNQMLCGCNNTWISTFHSLCANILRVHAEKLGYTPNFSIFNQSATERTIKRVLREKNLDEKTFKDKILSHISKAKNAGLDPDNYFAEIRLRTRDAITIAECYERYQEILKESNAMDFDDLLLRVIDLFNNHEEVLSYYQTRFKYIHIDEFQDTNSAQLEIAKLLSGKWHNIFAVGDDDQSIYGWRGADISNILEFEKNFPKVKIHKLTQNYRSTQEILDVANKIICKNQKRSPKKLFTDKSRGINTLYQIAYNDNQEAEWVVNNILSLKHHNDYNNSDIAILVRTNALTRTLETKLKENRIGYKVYGGFKFYERKEIQDILAYMRILTNPLDNEALSRIINFPRRGIGERTIEELQSYCTTKGISLFDAIMDINNNKHLSSAVTSKLNSFKELLDKLVIAKMTKSLYDFTIYLVEELELEKVYNLTDKKEDENKWENILEFIAQIKEIQEKTSSITVEEFLQSIILDSNMNIEEDEDDKLVLGTMHSVKGLEFKAVFIVGCEEGTFPSNMSLNEGIDSIEEERRVMYVAVTRARERLYISCAQRRFRYNKVQYYTPSRFLYEAKGEERQQPNYGIAQGGTAESYGQIGYNQAYPSSPRTQSQILPPKPSIQMAKPKIYNKDTDGFVSGAKIKHKRYGEGTIVVVEGQGVAKNATIAFKGLGIKKFKLLNAPIELIN